MGMQKGEHYDAYRRHHYYCFYYPHCRKAKDYAAEDGGASTDAHQVG